MNVNVLLGLLNGLIMIALPVLVGLYLFKRYGVAWRIWWIGAAAMALAQLGHIPFNMLLTSLFQTKMLPSPPEEYRLIFNAVVLGLSAGMWEEWFRYIAYRWMAKDARSWGQGLMLGAGHGGIEAIVLGVLVLISLFQIVALSGMDDLSKVIPAAQLPVVQQQLDAYWAAPWYMSIMGAVERVFAMIFHLTASVIVLQAFLGGGLRWVWLAVAWHAVLDATTVMLIPQGALAVEAALFVLTLANLGLLAWLRRRTPDPVERAVEPLDTGGREFSPEAPASPGPEQAPLDVDDLEKSKFL